MKLLIVSKAKPGSTLYYPPKKFHIWCLGRQINNYIYIKVAEEGETFDNDIIKLQSYDINIIKTQIYKLFNITE